MAFRALKAELETAGLRINADKSGFLTSAKEVSKEINQLLTPEDPAHYDVLRELGVDATATRRRRVTQVRKRRHARRTLTSPKKSSGSADCILSLEECWPVLLHKLIEQFKWQRLLRLTRYEGCHDLERPLDWTVSWKLQKSTRDKIATALRAFHHEAHCMVSKANAHFGTKTSLSFI